MSSRNNEIFRIYQTLSEKGSGKAPELSKTACINPQIRELIGFIDLYNIINGTNEFQREKKALIHFGRLTWPRTEISDLGFLLGEGVTRVRIRGIKRSESDFISTNSEENL